MPLLSRLRLPALSPANLCRRAFGSAAALRYDDLDEYDEASRPVEDADGCVSGRGVQWIILGNPMAKRHVYAEGLAKLLRVPHISMGTLVKQELHPNSFLYKKIANAVNQDQLVPDEVIFGLLSKRLEEGYCRGESGFILDGIPRSKIQAEILDEFAEIDLVLNFKCAEDCLVKNCVGGQACSSCQDFLGLGSSSLSRNLHPKVDTMKPVKAGPDVSLGEKLRIYAEQTKPVEDYYKKQKKLLDFQVAGAPGETWHGLLAALHLQHMSILNSSQKLNA